MNGKEEKLYYLMYDGKFVEPFRITGYYRYRLHENKADTKPMLIEKAKSSIPLLVEDNGLNKDLFSIVEVGP